MMCKYWVDPNDPCNSMGVCKNSKSPDRNWCDGTKENNSCWQGESPKNKSITVDINTTEEWDELFFYRWFVARNNLVWEALNQYEEWKKEWQNFKRKKAEKNT